MNALDLFAGPGGWDVGARDLGLDPLGIEWDDAACRVRQAAGLRTLQADVADLDPRDFPCDLLIASPPCTAFSMAGKGEGRKVLDELVGAMYDLGKSEANSWQTHGPYPLSTDDETARLVLEPLRWALAIRPRMVACEQVPPVLPLWEAMAQVLRARGYHTWSGVLSAEQYGIVATCPEHDPQPVHIAGLPSCPTSLATADPAATPWAAWQESVETAGHRSTFLTALASVHHVATGNAIGEHGTEALSDAWTVASLARVVLDDASDATWHSLVLDLLRRALPARRTPRGRVGAEWTNAAISASGWTGATGENIAWSPSSFWGELCALARSYIMSMETSPTTHPTTSGCSPTTALTRTSTTQARSRSECSLCDDLATPQTRKRAFLIASLDGPVGEPLATHQRYVAPLRRDDIGAGLFDLPDPERIVARGEDNLLPWVSMAEALGWGMTHRPYPAVASSRTTGGPDKEKVGGSGAREILYAEQAAGRWVFERPATTVQADSRIWPPGHKMNADDEAAGRDGYGDRKGTDAIRVTEEEAACLQSFPDGYPWYEAGTRSAAFRCIGNAVPPLMAEAVLRAVLR